MARRVSFADLFLPLPRRKKSTKPRKPRAPCPPCPPCATPDVIDVEAFEVVDVTPRKARNVARELGQMFGEGITPRRLARGMNVEAEHRDVTRGDPRMTARIALAHLRERPDYYERLARIEREPLQLPAGKPKRKRAKRAARPRQDFAAIESTVEQLESDPFAIPQPIGGPGYRPRECASDSPEWGEPYAAAIEAATERAAIEAGDDEAEFKRLLRLYFDEQPHASEWSRIERQCVAQFRARRPRKRRRHETASSETRHAIENAAREMGEDIRGSAEHFDRLTLRGKASYWRRLHKRTGSVDALRRAREYERADRTAKRKGRGVVTFAVG